METLLGILFVALAFSYLIGGSYVLKRLFFTSDPPDNIDWLPSFVVFCCGNIVFSVIIGACFETAAWVLNR